MPIETSVRVQIPTSLDIMFLEITAPSAPLANSVIMSTLTICCWWEDERMRERTGHPLAYSAIMTICCWWEDEKTSNFPSYVEDKKIK